MEGISRSGAITLNDESVKTEYQAKNTNFLSSISGSAAHDKNVTISFPICTTNKVEETQLYTSQIVYSILQLGVSSHTK